MVEYVSPCIAVECIETSRVFYEKLLGQTVKYDFGENVTYNGTFAIQLKPHFASMIGKSDKELKSRPNNFELAFETEDLDAFIVKLNNWDSEIKYLHDIIEHDWGQRVIRFYDPSDNVIEVGEKMESVVMRYLRNGLSIKAISQKTQFPVDFVQSCKTLLDNE